MKKWSSFDDLKADISAKSVILPAGTNANNFKSILEDVQNIIKHATVNEDTKSFYKDAYSLTKLLKDVDASELKKIDRELNISAAMIRAVFDNVHFQDKLADIMNSSRSSTISPEQLASRKYIRAGFALAFCPLALTIGILKENNFIFLRKFISDSIRHFLWSQKTQISFAKVAFVLESIASAHEYELDLSREAISDKPLFISILKIGRALSGITFSSLTISQTLGEKFRTAYYASENPDYNLSEHFNAIYSFVYKVEREREGYFNDIREEIQAADVKRFTEAFINNNERNVLFFIKIITSDFQYKKEKRFYQIILAKLSKAKSLLVLINKYAKDNLRGFKEVVSDEGYEWSNKIYLISLRTLSVLSELSEAKDERWMVSVTIRELKLWIQEVHGVLNKFEIEDDWDFVADCLEKETSDIEWKASFFTPIEKLPQNEAEEKGMSEYLFGKIIHTILGMMNTNGGVILVGHVEKPENIEREDIKNKLLVKNYRTFFDIGYELESRNKSIDHLRLQILQHLKNMTGETQDKFNNLINLEPIVLKDKSKSVTIIKIVINKALRNIYTFKKEKETVWISLTKRGDGQTIDVDLRNYLQEQQKN